MNRNASAKLLLVILAVVFFTIGIVTLVGAVQVNVPKGFKFGEYNQKYWPSFQ